MSPLPHPKVNTVLTGMTPREIFIDKALMVIGTIAVMALLIGRYAI